MRLREIYLGAVLMVLPLLYKTTIEGGDPVRFAKILGFFFFTSIAIGLFLTRYVKLNEALLTGYILFNAAYTGLGTAQTETVFYILMALASLFLLKFGDDSFNKRILRYLIWGGVPVAILGFLQVFNIDPVFNAYLAGVDRDLPRTFFGQETVSGPWFSCLAVASLFLGNYVLAISYFALVILAKSSFAFASFVAGFWVYLFWRISTRAFVVLTFASSALAILVIYIGTMNEWTPMNSTGRYAIWAESLHFLKPGMHCSDADAVGGKNCTITNTQTALTGFGIGTYKVVFPAVFQDDLRTRMHGKFEQAHNEYIQILFELGFIGLSLFLWNLYDFIKAIIRLKSNRYAIGVGSMFVVLAVDGIGSFPFHLMPHGVLALWAFFLITRYKDVKHGGRIIIHS